MKFNRRVGRSREEGPGIIYDGRYIKSYLGYEEKTIESESGKLPKGKWRGSRQGHRGCHRQKEGPGYRTAVYSDTDPRVRVSDMKCVSHPLVAGIGERLERLGSKIEFSKPSEHDGHLYADAAGPKGFSLRVYSPEAKGMRYDGLICRSRKRLERYLPEQFGDQRLRLLCRSMTSMIPSRLVDLEGVLIEALRLQWQGRAISATSERKGG